MSKVIPRLLWFCITTLCDWFRKLTPLCQPMGIQTKPKNMCSQNLCFGCTSFSALGASYMYLLRLLIGSLCCLHLLRLARAITLVLVLRHSIGNRSNRGLVLIGFRTTGPWTSNMVKAPVKSCNLTHGNSMNQIER